MDVPVDPGVVLFSQRASSVWSRNSQIYLRHTVRLSRISVPSYLSPKLPGVMTYRN